VFVDEVGQRVKTPFSASREVVINVRDEMFVSSCCDFRQIRATPPIVLEESVPQCSRNGTARASFVGEESVAVNEDSTVMDLVTVHG
jgi:hypothetical protein